MMKLEMPHGYRYEVSRPGFGVVLNRYGWQVIGVAVKFGRYAYGLKWAWAR